MSAHTCRTKVFKKPTGKGKGKTLRKGASRAILKAKRNRCEGALWRGLY